jgi:FMN phosphatase YigB (HAD superfamily)
MSSSHKLTDYKFLVFDVYGTLIDWESGIHTAFQPLLSRFTSSAQWSRKDVIQKFASIEIEIQSKHPRMPYSQVLAEVHKALEKELIQAEPAETHRDVSTPEEHIKFSHSIKHWSPFLDSSSALHTLARHFKLIVLSNVDHTSFADSHAYLSEGSESSTPTPRGLNRLYTRPTNDSNALWLPRTIPGSKSPFSLIMTAQDTGAYKPSLDGFNTVFKHLATEPELTGSSTLELTLAEEYVKARILVVAQSLVHDHVPAKKLGIRSVWIDRQGAEMRPDDGEDQEKWGWKWRFMTLGEMARAVELEVEEAGERK